MVMMAAVREVTVVRDIHQQEIGGFARLDRTRRLRETEGTHGVIRRRDDRLFERQAELRDGQMKQGLHASRPVTPRAITRGVGGRESNRCPLVDRAPDARSEQRSLVRSFHHRDDPHAADCRQRDQVVER